MALIETIPEELDTIILFPASILTILVAVASLTDYLRTLLLSSQVILETYEWLWEPSALLFQVYFSPVVTRDTAVPLAAAVRLLYSTQGTDTYA